MATPAQSESDAIVRKRVLEKDGDLLKLTLRVNAYLSTNQQLAANPTDASLSAVREAQYNEIARDLLVLSFQSSRLLRVSATLTAESNEFHAQSAAVQSTISDTQRELTELRLKLKAETAARQHRQACDLLAKAILQRQSVADTRRQIAAIQAEIDRLEQRKAAIECEKSIKVKQFSAVVNAIEQMTADWNRDDAQRDQHTHTAASTNISGNGSSSNSATNGANAAMVDET